jgi:hypothetical protein
MAVAFFGGEIGMDRIKTANLIFPGFASKMPIGGDVPATGCQRGDAAEWHGGRLTNPFNFKRSQAGNTGEACPPTVTTGPDGGKSKTCGRDPDKKNILSDAWHALSIRIQHVHV